MRSSQPTATLKMKCGCLDGRSDHACKFTHQQTAVCESCHCFLLLFLDSREMTHHYPPPFSPKCLLQRGVCRPPPRTHPTPFLPSIYCHVMFAPPPPPPSRLCCPGAVVFVSFHLHHTSSLQCKLHGGSDVIILFTAPPPLHPEEFVAREQSFCPPPTSLPTTSLGVTSTLPTIQIQCDIQYSHSSWPCKLPGGSDVTSSLHPPPTPMKNLLLGSKVSAPSTPPPPPVTMTLPAIHMQGDTHNIHRVHGDVNTRELDYLVCHPEVAGGCGGAHGFRFSLCRLVAGQVAAAARCSGRSHSADPRLHGLHGLQDARHLLLRLLQPLLQGSHLVFRCGKQAVDRVVIVSLEIFSILIAEISQFAPIWSSVGFRIFVCVTPSILQSQFVEKGLKKTENFECNVVLLMFIFTLDPFEVHVL